jgi:hypothetical protein
MKHRTLTLYVTQVTIALNAKVKSHILRTDIRLSFSGISYYGQKTGANSGD